jgi:hypothetical protein
MVKGVNGAVNGSRISTVSGSSFSTTATTFSTQGNTEKQKATNGSVRSRKSHQDGTQVKEKSVKKTKEKVSRIWQLIIGLTQEKQVQKGLVCGKPIWQR